METGIMGINSPLPGLIKDHYNPLDMGKYIGNPNHNSAYTDFMQSEFNTGGPGLAVMSDVYYGDGQKNTFGNSQAANQFKKYLESIGVPIHSGPQDGVNYNLMSKVPVNQELNLVQPGGPSTGVISQPGGPINPGTGMMPFPDLELKQVEMPDYTDKFAGYDTKIGGFDNQFKDIITRLDKLEQGIGSMANTNVPAPTPVQGGVPSVYTGNNARGY